MIWDRQTDSFGVPVNMFGPISDEMFGVIGRVVAVASLVELNAIDLVTRIDCVPQRRPPESQSLRFSESASKPRNLRCLPMLSGCSPRSKML